MMRTRCSVLAYALLGVSLAVVASGCRRAAAPEPPAATVAVSLARTKVPIGSPLEMTYRFEVAPDAKITGDYLVFVHVIEPDGEQLWGDDHPPSIPTSQWKPGQTVSYNRTVFVPNYPYIGPAVVRIGLYNKDTGDRLTLGAKQASRKEYDVASFELQPQSDNIFLIYKDGWHPSEVATDNPGNEWQWTKKSASLSFKNPRKDGTLYLEYSARSDKFTAPQQVTVRSGDQVIGTFSATSRDKTLVTLPVSAAQLGSADVSELSIDVDRTFTPGGADARELGIQVFHVFLQPK